MLARIARLEVLHRKWEGRLRRVWVPPSVKRVRSVSLIQLEQRLQLPVNVFRVLLANLPLAVLRVEPTRATIVVPANLNLVQAAMALLLWVLAHFNKL